MTTRSGSDVTDHDRPTATRPRSRTSPLLDLPESFDVEALARRQDLLPIPTQVQTNVPRTLPVVPKFPPVVTIPSQIKELKDR